MISSRGIIFYPSVIKLRGGLVYPQVMWSRQAPLSGLQGQGGAIEGAHAASLGPPIHDI